MNYFIYFCFVNELISHIQFLIRRHNRVDIPEFGTMHSVELPPFFSDKGELLIPPARKIYFDSDKPADCKNLIDSYKRKYKIKESDAGEKIQRDVRELKDNLNKNGMVLAGRLGQFYMKKNEIDFIANINSDVYNPYVVYDKVRKGKSKIKGLNFKLRSMAVIASLIAYGSGILSSFS